MFHLLGFVCYTPERRYDTPENLLLMVSLNWLRNDSKKLLEYSGFPKLLAKQKNLVQKVFNATNSIIEKTSLQDIREKSGRISKRMFDDMVVNNLIKKVTERIENGYIQDYNYLELKKWVITYMAMEPCVDCCEYTPIETHFEVEIAETGESSLFIFSADIEGMNIGFCMNL